MSKLASNLMPLIWAFPNVLLENGPWGWRDAQWLRALTDLPETWVSFFPAPMLGSSQSPVSS